VTAAPSRIIWRITRPGGIHPRWFEVRPLVKDAITEEWRDQKFRFLACGLSAARQFLPSRSIRLSVEGRRPGTFTEKEIRRGEDLVLDHRFKEWWSDGPRGATWEGSA
jgi:hypothetical protein